VARRAIEKPQRGADGFVPAQREDVVEPGGVAYLAGQPVRGRGEPLVLGRSNSLGSAPARSSSATLTSSSERIATSIVKALGPCAQPDDRLG
jgi:hypothetical protein